MIKEKFKSSIVFISTFPPRECGIATFTQDLANAVDSLFSDSIATKIVAMNVGITKYRYPKKVLFQIVEWQQDDYRQVAEKLNQMPEVRIINIQHEFGIFGGEYGSYLFEFLKEIKKPVVTTLHTVLPQPNVKLRDVVRKLADYSKELIVLNQLSKKILQNFYGIPSKKIYVIPHGIHPKPYRTSSKAKAGLGFSQRVVLATFGLLNRGKGIEYVLDALPEMVRLHPEVLYLIIGATHPVVLQNEGEAYRNFLTKKVFKNKLRGNVAFYNEYLKTEELLKFLEAMDIYVAANLDPNQVSSGSFSYAIGMGRPVVATQFVQAKDMVTERIGALVPFRNPGAIRAALLKLVANENLREQMGQRAYFLTRNMIWPNVALFYARIFSRYIPELKEESKTLFPVKFAHLMHLTDDFGMIQFARLNEPDRSSGYTVDDNARALLATVLHYEKFRKPFVLKLVQTYLDFLHLTLQPSGYFANYVKPDRTLDDFLNETEKTEDASARALWALAKTVNSQELPQQYRRKGRELFDRAFDKKISFREARSSAFYIKALFQFLRERQDDQTKKAALIVHCNRLISLFRTNSSESWPWFEKVMTYSNALLPEALILGFAVTQKMEYRSIAEKSFDFLSKVTFQNNLYIPIGQSGWYQQGGKRHFFDQQAEDVTATVQALRSFYEVTRNPEYKKKMYQAFRWFYGNNTLGQIVYDPTTGGCFDGVSKKAVNLNQGAESTVSYLLARLSL